MCRKLLGLVLLVASVTWADDELEKRATWTMPTASNVKPEIDRWLADKKVDEIAKAKLDLLWPAEGAATGVALLDQVTTTFAVFDPAAKEVVDMCRRDEAPVPLPTFAILSDEKAPPFVRNNLKLLYGCWLSQHQHVDESLEFLAGLNPTDVVDPAALLFYQSVAYHRLLEKEKCIPALEKLLENEKLLPVRYTTVARLMEADLKPLKKDSLDEVARLMSDIQRRLNLGHAGKKVRKEEDDVIAKLDKMIEELEKQQQGGGGGGSGSGGANNPSSPMQDSNLAQQRGEGNVEAKKLGKNSDWGNLPPKERQEALQQLTKELPAHYREVIEEYFRKLAADAPK